MHHDDPHHQIYRRELAEILGQTGSALMTAKQWKRVVALVQREVYEEPRHAVAQNLGLRRQATVSELVERGKVLFREALPPRHDLP